MRAYRTGLNANQSLTYDKTKNSTLGRVTQRTINSNLVSGPPLNVNLDVFTDAAITPSTGLFYTDSDRVFIVSNATAGAVTIALYNLDPTTGAQSYVGKITLTTPNTAATTHTIRGFKVDDTGTTDWKIFYATTGSVLINGGLFIVNSIDLADFTPGGTVIPIANDLVVSDMKGVYFVQDPSAIGVNHAMTATAGIVMDKTAKRIYVHNGIAATHQYWVFDYNVSLAVSKLSVVTLTIASPGKVNYTAHGFNANDQVTLTTTGALPTGLVAGTVYFVRNTTANDFELSATSGGASINFTGAQSGVHTLVRAFGISESAFLHKTGNLPALTGTLILLNSETFATPAHGHILTSGFDCVVFFTNSLIYVGRLSELTSGAITWPSLNSVNILGAASEAVAPSVLQGTWAQDLDCAVYLTNVSTFVAKHFVNNEIIGRFASSSTQYVEALPSVIPTLGSILIAAMTCGNGWILATSTNAGQRTAVGMDLHSDDHFDYSVIITPVFPSSGVSAEFVATIEELYEVTSSTNFYYRTGPLADTMFDVETGGWIAFPIGADLSALAVDEAVQIKVTWSLQSVEAVPPAQLADLVFGYTPDNELSSNWDFSHKHTVSTTPSKSAFRLVAEYTTLGLVPPMYFRAYDDSGALLKLADTVTDAADFEYSTNDGVSWLPLGTIPHTPYAAWLRYNWATPPGVNVSVSIRES